MEDTGARGSQEEQERKVPKKVRFSEEEDKAEPDSADLEVAQSGGTDGAAAQGDKWKREDEYVIDRGMGIDKLVDAKSLGVYQG